MLLHKQNPIEENVLSHNIFTQQRGGRRGSDYVATPASLAAAAPY